MTVGHQSIVNPDESDRVSYGGGRTMIRGWCGDGFTKVPQSPRLCGEKLPAA